MIFLKPINQYENVLACDEFSDNNSDKDNLGTFVSNAIFHFEKGHPFIQKSLEYFPLVFNGKWGSGGPEVFQNSLKDVCNTMEVNRMYKNVINPENCKGLTVLPPKKVIYFSFF